MDVDHQRDPHRLIEAGSLWRGFGPFAFSGERYGRVDRAMRHLARARYFVFGLVVVACAWTMTGHAQQQPPINGQWTVVSTTVRPISGPTVQVGMEGRMINSQTLFASERATLTAATVGKLATGVLRRANGAYMTYSLLKGVFESAGWGINELQNQVVQYGTPQQEMAPGETVRCYMVITSLGGGMRCTMTEQGALRICNEMVPLEGGGWTHCTWNGVTAAGDYLLNVYEGDFFATRRTLYKRTLTEWQPDWGTGSADVPITDEQILSLLQTSRPDLFAELLKDENGNVIVTPEVAAAMNRFREALDAMSGTSTPPVVSDPGTVEEGEGDASPKAWPAFCNWASIVCEFIREVKEQPDIEDVPMPERDAVIEEQHWSSGMASDGVCPAPETVDFTLMKGSYSVSFEYTPMCSLAQMMRPVLLTIAGVLSVFIVAGLRKAGGAS